MVAVPFRFLQRPAPCRFTSRAISRIRRPYAIVTGLRIGPTSSNHTPAKFEPARPPSRSRDTRNGAGSCDRVSSFDQAEILSHKPPGMRRHAATQAQLSRRRAAADWKRLGAPRGEEPRCPSLPHPLVATRGMRGGHRSDRSEVPPAFSREPPQLLGRQRDRRIHGQGSSASNWIGPNLSRCLAVTPA